MVQYIGVDLHEKTAFAMRVNEKGKVLQHNLMKDPETLRSFFKKSRLKARWWWKPRVIDTGFITEQI